MPTLIRIVGHWLQTFLGVWFIKTKRRPAFDMGSAFASTEAASRSRPSTGLRVLETSGKAQMPKSTRESLPTLTTNELVRSWDLLGRHCIAVVQATESPQRCDLAARWRRGRNPTTRSVLPQSEMSPVLVVIANVLIQQLSQVFLIQHDQMIREISTCTATQCSAIPFCQGLRNAARIGWLPIAFTVETTSALNFASRSKIKNRWADRRIPKLRATAR